VVQRKRKKVKRKPGKKSSNYFTKETDTAIKQWQDSSCEIEKNAIYEKDISPAFQALVNNLMWVYRFKIPREDLDTAKQDCVAFLYEKLDKWDPERGAKAFSYYNIAARRWMIHRSNKAIKESRRQIGITEKSDMSPWDWHMIESYSVVSDPTEEISKKDLDFVIGKMLDEFDDVAKTDREIRAAKGIRYLFENASEVDIFNRRSIIVYLREITGMEQSDLSSAMQTLRKKYRQLTGKRGIFAYDFWEEEDK
jgi:hypothetical protein